MSMLNDEIQNAKKVVFLTGAGVSTASGIPDYRSKQGIYANGKSPEYMLSHDCLMNEPEAFHDFVVKNLYFPDAKPNVIHRKMAALANEGKAIVITQNVDNLYRKAGIDPTKLIEFHGNLYDVYCQKCKQNVDWHEFIKDIHHQNCGGILRSHVVLYDEGIDPQNITKSIQALRSADLIVIVGTSFVVYPFAGLLQYRNPHSKVIAINKEPINIPSNGMMIVNDAVKEFAQVTD
ncbi:NAD-dependent protein deacylase [Ligilactobacillus cholophilus]|uniref:NAD-dependent protein deacylase n=1 Tax=Ligilactobacillus cholophilus TaxID=3050131 RepID=UPI0025B12691|nr:NAD-dependent protein deacylase [Ligilactobacillus cholophilus]